MSTRTTEPLSRGTRMVPRVTLGALLGPLAGALILAGCVTTGGGQFETSIYDTHKRVQKLDQDLDGSLRELNETTAALVARVDAGDEQLRRLRTLAEENQVKLNALNEHLSGLKSTLFRTLEIGSASPVAPSTDAAPDTVVPSAAAAPAAAAPPSVEYASPNLHYQNAHKLYRDKDYEAALREFDLFMQRYPDDPVTSNAQYWKAYCLLLLGRDEESLPEFRKVYERYPSSNKAANAMLNEGKILVRQGQTDQARAILQRLMEDYPVSLASDEAKAALEKL